MPKLITEWSTDDPGLAEMLKSIAAEPEYSELRLEMEIALHQFQAKHTAEQLGRLRADRLDSERRRARWAEIKAQRAAERAEGSDA